MHTTKEITSIPYYNTTGVIARRLIVKPDEHPEVVNEHGLVIPQDTNVVCETGTVISICQGSAIKKGDRIDYHKIDRKNDERSIIEIEGGEYDQLFENEVWSVNGIPFNRLFVEPLSEIELSDSGLIIPGEVLGVPQKGVIMSVPEGSLFSAGDTVEYRKAEQGMYPTVNVDGRVMDVLFERDIFTVNEEASPYKIIVKIDMAAQHLKRMTDSGLERSPLFLFMIHNLQYGQVISIGEKAKELYPELNKSDFAILHHTIEHQGYRLLRQKKNGEGLVTHEYRMINCLTHESREIFGRFKALNNKPVPSSIKLFGHNVLLKWDFEMFEQKEASKSEFIDMDFNLNEVHNYDEMHSLVDDKRKRSVDKYKSEFTRMSNLLGNLNPDNMHDKEEIDVLVRSIEHMKRDSYRQSSYVNANHRVKCKTINNISYSHIVTTYKELYPIHLLGKKYLIAHESFIIGTISKHMDNTTPLTPFGDQVCILPLEEKKESELILSEHQKEKPIRGRVISVGPGTPTCAMTVQPENEIYFKRLAGTEITIDGVEYLIMRQNDCLAWI